MLEFVLNLGWLRYVVIWLIHPDILNRVVRAFKSLLCFSGAKAVKIAPPPASPGMSIKTQISKQTLLPSSSLPTLGEVSLTAKKKTSVERLMSKSQFQNLDLNQCIFMGNWRDKIPGVFNPAIVDDIRLKTMAVFNTDASIIDRRFNCGV